MTTSPRILALWSAPRCRSTAFLRMMAERGDFVVLHEPFSHVADFGEAEVGGRRVHSEEQLVDALLTLSRRHRVFLKDTTDFHYPVLLARDDFLRRVVHTFLIRHPRAAIASHVRLNPALGCDEIGFGRLYEIYSRVRQVTGGEPVVVDSDELVRSPAALIERYCARVGIDFRPQALHWSPGTLPGWQRTRRWHTEVSASSGFVLPGPRAGSAPPADVEADPVLRGYLDHHLPFYERLYEARLRVGVPVG